MNNVLIHPLKKLMSFPFICWIIVVLIHISWNALGQEKLSIDDMNIENSYVTNHSISKSRGFKNDPGLNYPTSVERFYKEKGFQLQWVDKDHHNPQIVPAMILLDCVQQFGLDQQDFHPDVINYEKLEVLKLNKRISTEKERENFDVKLTDAMITFMNYLHYGKFNTKYSSIKTDWDNDGDFNAVNNLIAFLKSKDFFTAMTSVQPLSKEYDDLQKYMRLVRGQYMEDNYEFSEDKVKIMAINMERLRWLSTQTGNHIVLNIPSGNLKLYINDTTYNFTTKVGSILAQTPTLESRLTHIAVAPEVKVAPQFFISDILPKALKNLNYLRLNRYNIYNDLGAPIQVTHNKLLYIQKNYNRFFSVKSLDGTTSLKKVVIYFDNTDVVDLHDAVSLKSVTRNLQIPVPSGIGVLKIKKLSALLLEQDGSGQKIPKLKKTFEKYNFVNFKLKKPIPIAVTYLTCEISDGQLVLFGDIYEQDQNLIDKMYKTPVTMIAEVKK